ncbi:DUF3459 domain-containing protein [Myxococcota bacterium]|nr:DUF3459 domain-containing protein [Myxococcota bacterium]
MSTVPRIVISSLALGALALACVRTPPPAIVALPDQTFAPPPESTGKTLETWANGAVFYEVFVRSFQDSNGDGKGDLAGLISRLDYLNDGDPATDTDLGVDALWLMPIFESPSYHGYDTTDYEKVEPDYGTNADLDRLIAEAHRRGIKIVVDLVLNHTSREHPWFVESASSPTSPKRDWYVWSATKLPWGQPWNEAGTTWHAKNGAYYYGVFWEGMPDLNFRNAEVRAEAKRLAAHWIQRGIDGYRLDATRHLIETGPGQTGQNDTEETKAFLRELAAHVRTVRPDAALIGENWTETPIIAQYYGSTEALPGGDMLPLNFDFPLAGKIIHSVRSGDAKWVAEKIAEIQRTYPAGATDVPFLTNHDMKRVATQLEEDTGKLKSAAALLLTLPGTPFLYYGEEVGLRNGPIDHDEAKRTPMPWDASVGGGFTTGTPWYTFAPGKESTNVAAQEKSADSLLQHYRRLIQLRQRTPVLRRGELRLVAADGPVLAFLRTRGRDRALVVHNLGATPLQTELRNLNTAKASPLFATPGASLSIVAGVVDVVLPAHSTVIGTLD